MGNKKDKPLNLLIIDDDKNYVDSLKLRARELRINLIHYKTLEESKEFLKSDKGKFVAGIILDVVCVKTKAQEVPDNSFITEALQYFDRYHCGLPKTVLTGEPEEYKNLQKLFSGTHDIFKKGDGDENILKYLLEKSSSLGFIRISRELPVVFEVFEKSYLDINARDDFIECSNNIKSSEQNIINDNLSRLRRIQEKIYIAINKTDPSLVPTEYISDGVKSRKIFNYITEKEVIKKHSIIDQFSWSVYTIASDYGAHTPNNTPDYSPTKYTVQALFFALCDLLLWFKEILENQNK